MTLSVGNKIIKCDDAGRPAEGEMYIFFEITECSNSEQVDGEVVYKHIALRKLVEPPGQPKGSRDA